MVKNILAYFLSVYSIFTALSSYASAVLEIVILSVRQSVCLSVTHVLCDETKEHTADILIPHESVIRLVSWYKQRLMAGIHIPQKFALKVTTPFEKLRLRPSAYNVSTARASEKCSIIVNI